ncbi:2Fe-2S ferredoxin-type domain-containing protein [Pelagophyceae sp. CCMP2097]|nr:2Fe-2S ferredoxin-type domain-containing protein [Pelagophyceae sp. CCMP2097]
MARSTNVRAACAAAALLAHACSAWTATHSMRPNAARARPATALSATHTVTLQLPDGSTVAFPCADDEFILDAAEENGIELPSSCRSGSCTSCQGRVLSGTVIMDDQSTLDDAQIAAGFTCTCVAYPESDVTVVTHQMDNFESGKMTYVARKRPREPRKDGPR